MTWQGMGDYWSWHPEIRVRMTGCFYVNEIKGNSINPRGTNVLWLKLNK